MDIPSSRWYAAIFKRQSHRKFDDKRRLDSASLEALEKVCRDFKPYSSARACLVNEPDKDIFTGIVGRYGKVTGAPAFVAFIGDMTSASAQEDVGYTGEGIILEATALGLDTCWVGGFFSRRSLVSLVQVKEHERVLAVTPVGYAVGSESFTERAMSGFGLNHKRLPLSKLITRGTTNDLPQWARLPLEAARIAPSAVNRQPWGFELNSSGIRVFVRARGMDFGVSRRLDCGIAMLHIEVGALTQGTRGSWQSLEGSSVGEFVLTKP
jgi:nitroreductase